MNIFMIYEWFIKKKGRKEKEKRLKVIYLKIKIVS